MSCPFHLLLWDPMIDGWPAGCTPPLNPVRPRIKAPAPRQPHTADKENGWMDKLNKKWLKLTDFDYDTICVKAIIWLLIKNCKFDQWPVHLKVMDIVRMSWLTCFCSCMQNQDNTCRRGWWVSVFQLLRLLSLPGKVDSTMLEGRPQLTVEPRTQGERCDFCPGPNTEDQIFTLAKLLKRSWELYSPVYMWGILWGVLWKCGVPGSLKNYQVP